MNKTLSNPAADLLNRVCSCFCRALREGACRQTGTHTSRLHIKHTFLKYFLKNIYFSRRTFSARRISPCWTPGCLTSKKAFFEEKQFTILPFSGWSPFSKTLPIRLQVSGPSWGKTGESPMGFSPLRLGILLTRHAFKSPGSSCSSTSSGWTPTGTSTSERGLTFGFLLDLQLELVKTAQSQTNSWLENGLGFESLPSWIFHMFFVACTCFCFSTGKKAVSPNFGKFFLPSLFSPPKAPLSLAKSASSASLESTHP